MTSFVFTRYGLTTGVAAALFAGCGGSQPPTGGPAAMPEKSIVQTHPDRWGSWMTPEASGEDLLYVAGSQSRDRVYVFTYSGGKHVGTLRGLINPDAVCVDASQNVWISSGRGTPSEMIEYAHGKTKRRATLPDNYGSPAACSIDPKTGNLAVANLYGNPSNIVVYGNAQGTGTVYSVANFEAVWGCAYDASGNLFASGFVYSSGIHVARLPAGGSKFIDLKLSQSFGGPFSGLKWDGTYLDLGIDAEIYQLLISGSKATVENTVTLVDADQWGFNFFVEGGTVISHVAPTLGVVGLWNFPSGGYPTQIIPDAHGEKSGSDQNGIAVSRAMDR